MKEISTLSLDINTTIAVGMNYARKVIRTIKEVSLHQKEDSWWELKVIGIPFTNENDFSPLNSKIKINEKTINP